MSIFSKIKRPRVKRSKFDLSRERKATYSFNNLYPVFLEECMPGDSFRVKVECLLRAFPMLAPLMHRVNVKMNFFFVPTRIIWNDWEDFITGGRLGEDAPILPYMTPQRITTVLGASTPFLRKKSVWDHFGLPTIPEDAAVASTNVVPINALPFRAYQEIYNTYFRDQNLQAEVEYSKTSGEITSGPDMILHLNRRIACWEKDYFTSALPWPQRGPEVLMPVEGAGSVTYKASSDVFLSSGNDPSDNSNLDVEVIGGNPTLYSRTDVEAARIENIDEVSVDNISTTINDFRKAVAIQRWLETAARAGSRYVEQVMAHFGVHTGDARLDRPEYIGGYSQPLTISEVLSTVDDSANDLPQGNMSGHGISVGSNVFKYSPREHGYIIGVMAIIPKTAYQNGVHRLWTRRDKFDFPFPEFANLGEQEVTEKEIYMNPMISTGNEDETWAYQSRYAEHKYGISSVHSDFRDVLSYWHLGRIFDSMPSLNLTFVQASASNRIFPVIDEEEDKFYAQMYMKVDAKRPLPYFGTPGLSKI